MSRIKQRVAFQTSDGKFADTFEKAQVVELSDFILEHDESVSFCNIKLATFLVKHKTAIVGILTETEDTTVFIENE